MPLLLEAYPEAVQLVGRGNRKWLPLHYAIAANGNSTDAVRLLLKAYPQALHEKMDEWLVLHYAAHKGLTMMVELILDSGVCVDTVDESGQTALHHSARAGHVHVVELLLSRGARDDIEDHDGRTARECAAQEGVEKILRGVCQRVLSVDLPMHLNLLRRLCVFA